MMTTFVLIPGAGGNAAFWSRLVPELARRGHEGIPVDIRQDDPALQLRDWAATVEAAVDGRPSPVLVAQSLGGFVAPLVAALFVAARRVPPPTTCGCTAG